VGLSFPVILGPRYKLKIVEYCFSKHNMANEGRDEKLEIIFYGIHKLYDNVNDVCLKTMNDSLYVGSSDFSVDILESWMDSHS